MDELAQHVLSCLPHIFVCLQLFLHSSGLFGRVGDAEGKSIRYKVNNENPLPLFLRSCLDQQRDRFLFQIVRFQNYYLSLYSHHQQLTVVTKECFFLHYKNSFVVTNKTTYM